jgi:type IV secretory pathway VirB3-like protein
MEAVTAALARFSAYLTALFVIVLVSALLQLVIALPVWLIRKLLGRA